MRVKILAPLKVRHPLAVVGPLGGLGRGFVKFLDGDLGVDLGGFQLQMPKHCSSASIGGGHLPVGSFIFSVCVD